MRANMLLLENSKGKSKEKGFTGRPSQKKSPKNFQKPGMQGKWEITRQGKKFTELLRRDREDLLGKQRKEGKLMRKKKAKSAGQSEWVGGKIPGKKTDRPGSLWGKECVNWPPRRA